MRIKFKPFRPVDGKIPAYYVVLVEYGTIGIAYRASNGSWYAGTGTGARTRGGAGEALAASVAPVTAGTSEGTGG